jgi:hypothetical protein
MLTRVVTIGGFGTGTACLSGSVAREDIPATGRVGKGCIEKRFMTRLLLDSRVVDLPIAYTPTFVLLSPLKPLFFNSLKNALRFLDNAGA